MATLSKPYLTTNLTLASVLLLRGHEARMVRQRERTKGHPIIGWEFDELEVASIVSDFYDGEICVEPEEFFQRIKQTREELFDFMDGNDG